MASVARTRSPSRRSRSCLLFGFVEPEPRKKRKKQSEVTPDVEPKPAPPLKTAHVTTARTPRRPPPPPPPPPSLADSVKPTLEERAVALLISPLLLEADLSTFWPSITSDAYLSAYKKQEALTALRDRRDRYVQLLFEQSQCALDQLGTIVYAALAEKVPKARKGHNHAAHVIDTSSPAVGGVTIHPKTRPMIEKFLVLAGFAVTDKGVYLAQTPAAATRIFGAAYSLSGRNHLRRLWPWKGHILNSKKQDHQIYKSAPGILGDRAFANHSDGTKRSLPAYVLRALLDDHVASELVLDNSLRAASTVDLEQPFTISFVEQYIPNTKINNVTIVNARMEWNGMRRQDKGVAPRQIFARSP